MIERPAAVRALDAAQIDPDLALQLQVRRLAEIMDEQDVFRRDGGVRLEFEAPVTVLGLGRGERARRLGDARIEIRGRRINLVSDRDDVVHAYAFDTLG